MKEKGQGLRRTDTAGMPGLPYLSPLRKHPVETLGKRDKRRRGRGKARGGVALSSALVPTWLVSGCHCPWRGFPGLCSSLGWPYLLCLRLQMTGGWGWERCPLLLSPGIWGV